MLRKTEVFSSACSYMPWRQWCQAVLIVAALWVVASPAEAQPFCVANAVPPQLRSEGITELGDEITLHCSGGTFTPGAQAPTTNFAFGFNFPIANSTSDPPVLSIDLSNYAKTESLVQGFNENAPSNLCPLESTCPAFTGLATVPDTSLQVPFGLASATLPTAGPSANVFPGLLSGNQVTFIGVPIVPPATSGSRVFRISNIRLNTSSSTPGSPVTFSITSSNPAAATIAGGQGIAAFVEGTERCGLGSLQWTYLSVLNNPLFSKNALVGFTSDANGNIEYNFQQNAGGVFTSGTGITTYSVSLTPAGCIVTTSFSKLDKDLASQTLYYDPASRFFSASAPGGFGWGVPVDPLVGNDSAYTLGGFHSFKIDAANTSFTGMGNFSGTSATAGTIFFQGFAYSPGHSTWVSGTGSFTVGSGGSGTVTISIPNLPTQYVIQIGGKGDCGEGGGASGISTASQVATIILNPV